MRLKACTQEHKFHKRRVSDALGGGCPRKKAYLRHPRNRIYLKHIGFFCFILKYHINPRGAAAADKVVGGKRNAFYPRLQSLFKFRRDPYPVSPFCVFRPEVKNSPLRDYLQNREYPPIEYGNGQFPAIYKPFNEHLRVVSIRLPERGMVSVFLIHNAHPYCRALTGGLYDKRHRQGRSRHFVIF